MVSKITSVRAGYRQVTDVSDIVAESSFRSSNGRVVKQFGYGRKVSEHAGDIVSRFEPDECLPQKSRRLVAIEKFLKARPNMSDLLNSCV